MKSCLSQRETRITYCVSCPLCFSIRKIKTSVRWFISPRSRCRTWNRFILPLIPRSCTISYIFSRSLIWLTRKHMLIYQLSASAPRKMLNPVALHMDHIIWCTIRTVRYGSIVRCRYVVIANKKQQLRKLFMIEFHKIVIWWWMGW